MVTPETIRTLIKSALKLADLPMNEEFVNLAFSNADLAKIQDRLRREYHHTVGIIFFKDTIYTLTDRFNESVTIKERRNEA